MPMFCCGVLCLVGSYTKKLVFRGVHVMLLENLEQEVVELLEGHAACVILTLYQVFDTESATLPCDELVCFMH